MTRILATPVAFHTTRHGHGLSLGIRLEFKPADCLVGLYWTRERQRTLTLSPVKITELSAWICLLPMLPIHVEAKWARRD